MAKVNPFKPGSPVSSGMFVGRTQELDRLETSLIQTRSKNPSHFMVTGERGIGKSSLLNYIKAVAEGHIRVLGPVARDETVNFLVIDTDIDQNTTQLGLISKIEVGLRRSLSNTEAARNFFTKTWEFLQRVEALGVSLKPNETKQLADTVFEEFAYSLADTVNRICVGGADFSPLSTRHDGVLLLIDEADNGSKQLGLGSFFKLLTERLYRRGCNTFMVGLAGLSSLRDVLSASHPSSLRIFEENKLERLSKEDVELVIESCLKEANRLNQQEYTITDEAKRLLVHYSEGYPHFIQQFGYSAFDVDFDAVIDERDVIAGAFGRGGALELIGDRYYRDDFYRKIQKDSYRQVLRIMSERLDGWIEKKEIRHRFKGTDTTLDNAIAALLNRHIIFPKEGERGVYRLQHKGFALWIRLRTESTSPSVSEEPPT